MRKTAILILITLIPLLYSVTIAVANTIVISGRPIVEASYSGEEETFEGAGAIYTWTDPGDANWNFDNTTTPINGSQDLKKSSSAGSNKLTKTDIGPWDNLYLLTKFKVISAGATDGWYIGIQTTGSSNTAYCVINTTTDTYYVTKVRAQYSGNSQNSEDTSITNQDCVSQVCYLKLTYNKGTGSDGVVNCQMVTYANYISSGWSSADSAGTTSSTDTVQAGKVVLGAGAALLAIQWDDIRWSSTDNADY